MRPIAPVTHRARVRFSHSQRVSAPPEAVFPLLCPVQELDWVPGWDCALVYTASGVAEPGCVFQTDRPAEGGVDTWVVSRHEPPSRVEFVRVNALRAMRYAIRLEPVAGGTRLEWSQEITSLSPDGDRHVAALSAADFAALVERLETMLEHYLRTGEALAAVAAG